MGSILASPQCVIRFIVHGRTQPRKSELRSMKRSFYCIHVKRTLDLFGAFLALVILMAMHSPAVLSSPALDRPSGVLSPNAPGFSRKTIWNLQVFGP